MIEAYPLQWPMGYRRNKQRTTSRFEQTPENAQKFLRLEIQRIGGVKIIVSTNVQVRNDGLIYSDMANTRILDPGVAVYFQWNGKDVVICCDKYSRVWENIYAIGKGIEGLRTIERHDISEFLDRAFTGFKALPEKSEAVAIAWWTILGVAHNATADQVKEAYRKLAAKYHPDKPDGDGEKFYQVKVAYEQAQSILSIK